MAFIISMCQDIWLSLDIWSLPNLDFGYIRTYLDVMIIILYISLSEYLSDIWLSAYLFFWFPRYLTIYVSEFMRYQAIWMYNFNWKSSFQAVCLSGWLSKEFSCLDVPNCSVTCT
jgi:hypothetical protein